MIRSVIIFCLKIGVLCGIVGSAIAVALVYYYSQDLPDYSQLAHYHPPAVTRIYSADGKLMEEYAKEHRVFVPISTIPPSLIEAFIAAEDKNFYEHQGIDVIGVIRAALVNVINVFQRRRMEGASTITQQVVKNFLLTSERSLPRKIKEAVLSYMISKSFSKAQILELYLNQIYLGHGAYGVAAAAQVYFNKSVEELTLAESAFIAALPKAPSSVNPDKHYGRAKGRRDYVLIRMTDDGYISASAAREAIDTPIKLVKRSKTLTITADYYAEKVRDEIIKRFGEEFFYDGGLTVMTSLNSEYQIEAEKALRKGIRDYDLKRGYRGAVAKLAMSDWQKELSALESPLGLLEYKLAVILGVDDSKAIIGLGDGAKSSIPIAEMKWAATNLKSAKAILKKGDVVVVEPVGKIYGLRQIPQVNGALLVMSPYTGQVFAMSGGYDFQTSKFDRATQAIRQPGSLSKTFTYLAALERDVSPDTIFEDSPVAIAQGPGMPTWRPKNFKGDFLGPMTMSDGLIKSRNPVTVRVAQHIGLGYVAEIIQRLGINETPKHVYSMVLGALESTLDKMVSAYSVFANGGFQVRPQFIEYIKDSNGKVIYRRDSGVCMNCQSNDVPQITEPPHVRLISSHIYRQINTMLQGAIERGTGRGAAKLGLIMAGKTGTTNKAMDTWFVGFTPNIIAGTYIGYDTPKSLGNSASGANVALPVVVEFMQHIKIPSIPFDFSNNTGTVAPVNVKDVVDVKINADDGIFNRIPSETQSEKGGEVY